LDCPRHQDPDTCVNNYCLCNLSISCAMLLTLFIQQLENNAAGMEINVAVDLLLEIAVLTPTQTNAKEELAPMLLTYYVHGTLLPTRMHIHLLYFQCTH
jgi:hypothetical protein